MAGAMISSSSPGGWWAGSAEAQRVQLGLELVHAPLVDQTELALRTRLK
jgi:hypothetical protein